jgi:hypothetical protein
VPQELPQRGELLLNAVVMHLENDDALMLSWRIGTNVSESPVFREQAA